ncbi:MAG: M2 family metallopeptidase [Parachlamydiales bacterium]
MNKNENIKLFLEDFYNQISVKEEQLNKAAWLLETTGSKDAADLVASLSNEYKLFFSNENIYKKLIEYSKIKSLDNLTKRQIDILIDSFKANMIPKELMKEISIKESELYQAYANFRPMIDNKKVSENQIREILENEKSIDIRKKAWEASKEVGAALAPKIIELAKLRNQAAKHVGYDNYFDMMLDLNEINKEKLFQTFADLKKRTDKSFNETMMQINEVLAEKFSVPANQLGPWAWKEPHGQEDPIKSSKLNDIFSDKDILAIAKSYYEKMGFDIDTLIKNSDLYEREGKNQHAFCTDIDRKKDVRTLNNIKPNPQWMETLLHEFGHAVYDLNINEKLPWLLRQPAHIFVTEAIALLMGRQPYTKEFLMDFCNISDEKLFQDIHNGAKRRQLIFSRFVFLMTEFESNLYSDPNQDLNKLWWDLYEKYYNLPKPKNREGKADWAAKYHIGLAPVYYYNYLLGEVLASMLNQKLIGLTKDNIIWKKQAADFLTNKMFRVGSSYRWDDLVEHVTNQKFSIDSWVNECNN